MYKYIFIISTLFISILWSNDNLSIVFEERIPYVIKQNDTISGLVATPVINALNYSHINYTLKEKPSKRHLYEVKANVTPMCAIGWFKNKDREKYAKFTLPLYQDKPLGIVSRDTFMSKFTNIDIDILLKNKNYSLLTKASYSYGKFLDEKIKKFNVTKKEVFNSNEKMIELISKKRADYMFISPEEASTLLKKTNIENIHFFKINNMPAGSKRYLLCSKKVSNKTINKINTYLEKKDVL